MPHALHSSPDASATGDAFPLGWALAPAAVLALLAGLVAATGSNAALFSALNGSSAFAPARMWAAITLCGSVPGALALLAPTIKTQPRWLAGALLGAPLAALFSEGGKRFFDVMRPSGVLEAGSFQQIGQVMYVHSLPSGHAVTAFCVAAAVVLAWPHADRRRHAAGAALMLAGLVALSRIAVGAHWPLDLLVGAAGGWLAGAFGVWLAQRVRLIHPARGARLMAILALVASLAMLFIDLGQPDVRLFRIGLAAWGIGGATAALMQDRESDE